MRWLKLRAAYDRPMHIRSASRLLVTRSARLLLLCLTATLAAAPSPGNAQTMQGTPAQGMHDSHPAAPIADMLTLSVDGRSLQLSPADLAALPQTSVTVHNGHTKAEEQYTGVALSDLLARAGVAFAPGTEQRFFHSYLRAQGTDFYFVVYSGTEIESALHKGNVLVALRLNGQPLGSEGRFKMISTEDTRPARWVRNLNNLTFVTLN